MQSSRTAIVFVVGFSLLWAANGHAGNKFPTKLFLSADGIALSSFPSRHSLKHTITVDRTSGTTPVNWTATSDQSWLSVTPSGMTGGTLSVRANPRKLTKDQSYIADVTVSTNGGDFTDTETLRVGMWVGSTDTSVVTVQQNAFSIASNPVEPIAYVAEGTDSIYEYNVYSGQLVGTLSKVAPTVGAMEVSSDGHTLFVADTTNYKVIALDADKGTEIATFSLGYPINSSFNMVYARPYAEPALYTQSGPIFSVPSGNVLGNDPQTGFIAVTPDGRKLFTVDLGVDPGTLYNYRVAAKGENLTVTSIISASVGDNCADLAVSHDGRHVYPACGAPYEFDVYDGKTLSQVQTLPANPYPNNIEIDLNDHVVGGINGLYQTYDVYVFNQQGYSLGEVDTTQESYDYGQQPAVMKVSADGMRVISATGYVYNATQTLMFRDLPQ